ncbi:MAG: DUF4230 domain-containing protein [Spirochaetales bacterium]|nr:DUF4230 domain-containing protein [Spirochaetales bacterium]
MARKKKKSLLPILRILSLTALAVLLAGAVYFVSHRLEQNRAELLSDRLEQLGELTTVTQLYRSVFYTREKKNFIQDKSLLFTVEYNVEAGIDLSEGFDFTLNRGRGRLILPPGRILLVDADDTSFRQVLVKERFSSIDTGDFLPLVAEEALSIREEALGNGLPREAEEKALILMKGILGAAGLEDIEIEFRREPAL